VRSTFLIGGLLTAAALMPLICESLLSVCRQERQADGVANLRDCS
jgi:hypothetical protein